MSMFIPATSAIICMIYFKSSALTRETKIVFTFFLLSQFYLPMKTTADQL
ncbi:hypothetical protein [uncultured Methanobacterium sp.]|nr:hypothetical protein [uncultured Methanobacterium sp.]